MWTLTNNFSLISQIPLLHAVLSVHSLGGKKRFSSIDSFITFIVLIGGVLILLLREFLFLWWQIHLLCITPALTFGITDLKSFKDYIHLFNNYLLFFSPCLTFENYL